MDIGGVDGEICRGTRTGRCATLASQLAAVTGPVRSRELIYWRDPDGPNDPRGFARGKEPKIVQLPRKYGNWLPDKALPEMRDVATANPDLKVVFSESDVMQAGTTIRITVAPEFIVRASTGPARAA